jgi:hypothetical protein
MQNFWDTKDWPNLPNIGEEGGEVQDVGIENIFNKTISENFPNLEKERTIQYRRLSEHQIGKSQKKCH